MAILTLNIDLYKIILYLYEDDGVASGRGRLNVEGGELTSRKDKDINVYLL